MFKDCYLFKKVSENKTEQKGMTLSKEGRGPTISHHQKHFDETVPHFTCDWPTWNKEYMLGSHLKNIQKNCSLNSTGNFSNYFCHGGSLKQENVNSCVSLLLWSQKAHHPKTIGTSFLLCPRGQVSPTPQVRNPGSVKSSGSESVNKQDWPVHDLGFIGWSWNITLA